MTQEHTSGTSEPRVGLDSEEHGSQAEEEARAVELVATEVLPQIRVEELTLATTQFLQAENILELNAEAVTSLEAFESTGTVTSASGSSHQVDPAKPPSARVLARRAGFQRSAATVWPRTTPVDTASSMTASTVAKAMVDYYSSRQRIDPKVEDRTRSQVEQGTANFGTSLDQYVKSRMPVDATEPGCTDAVVLGMRNAGVAPDRLLAAVDRFTDALSSQGVDVAAATTAGNDLLGILREMDKVLAGQPLAEIARYVEMTFGVCLSVGGVLQDLADGKPVTPRSDTARGHDLCIRLRALEASPNSERVEKLANARRRAASTQDLIDQAGSRIVHAKGKLAALVNEEQTTQQQLANATTEAERTQIRAELTQNALEQRTLATAIANDQSDIPIWNRRLSQIRSEVGTVETALTSDAADYAKVKATITSPGKGKKFTTWRDSVDRLSKGLGKLDLDPEDLTALQGLLSAVREGIDQDFVRQMKTLSDLGTGTTTEIILNDGWAFARRLSDAQDGLNRILKALPPSATDVQTAVRQLQTLASALAGSLSDRIAARVGLGDVSGS